ncbi:uncharacterized protein LOC132797816 [Drosophila nasuta]|uniref:uncharacterized protein LOC132797816 n=1 Tax=Drosophila nasuta TaxID=42062 RepID=UPI00295E3E9F|nr:uncharacterized protein LOC132797816 [Drosophila nasuta]
MLHGLEINGSAANSTRQLMSKLTQACDASMRKAGRGTKHQPVYWWNQDIAKARKDCFQARRRYQRTLTLGSHRADAHHQALREKRRILKSLIKSSKRKLFLELCDEADADPWGYKPPEDPSGYRPICLLDSVGKALERVICTRLNAEIDRVGGLSESQFGFRKARSTRHAIQEVTDLAKKAIEGKRWLWGEKEYCLVVTLDVRNAFNSANWEKIMQSLNNLSINPHLIGIIGSYLNGRILRYQTSEGTKTYEVTGGVPQGSVLGPTLWNLMYDGILRLRLPPGVKMIGFADDVAIVAVGKHLRELEIATNRAIVQAQEWLTNAGLSLAEHKTEAVLISSRKTVETANLTVHLKLVADKASVACSALARIMPNTRGPKELRRRLISGVVRSITTYAASIWRKQSSEQADFPKRVAAQVEFIQQRRMDAYPHPGVSEWVNRKHGQVNYYLTQLLSGHGCFKDYLFRFGHEADPLCPRCGIGYPEDAEHVFFNCPRFRRERESVERKYGEPVTPSNLVYHMLANMDNWEAADEMANAVMKELRREERSRRTEDGR